MKRLSMYALIMITTAACFGCSPSVLKQNSNKTVNVTPQILQNKDYVTPMLDSTGNVVDVTNSVAADTATL